jgi:hypothetical protein
MFWSRTGREDMARAIDHAQKSMRGKYDPPNVEIYLFAFACLFAMIYLLFIYLCKYYMYV